MTTAAHTLLAVTMLAIGVTSARAVEVEPVGRWVIKSGQGRTGAYCTAEVKQDGRTLGVQVMQKDRSYVFGATNPAWHWTPRTTYESRWQVSGGSSDWRGDSIAVLPDTLVFFVTDKPDPIAAMKTATAFTIEAGGSSSSFDLSGFAEADAALEKCLVAPKGDRS